MKKWIFTFLVITAFLMPTITTANYLHPQRAGTEVDVNYSQNDQMAMDVNVVNYQFAADFERPSQIVILIPWHKVSKNNKGSLKKLSVNRFNYRQNNPPNLKGLEASTTTKNKKHKSNTTPLARTFDC